MVFILGIHPRDVMVGLRRTTSVIAVTCHHEDMMPKQEAKRLELWQPLEVVLEEEPACFIVTVAAHFPDLLQYIVEGHLDLVAPPRSAHKRSEYMILLQIQRPAAAAVSTTLLRSEPKIAPGSQVRVYCRGAALLPGDMELGLLCSTKPGAARFISSELIAAAQRSINDHRSVLAKQAADRTLDELKDDQLVEAADSTRREELRRLFEHSRTLRGAMPPPLPDARAFLHLFAPGVVVKLRAGEPEQIQLEKHLRRNPHGRHPPPRTGVFEAILAGGPGTFALCTWIPHFGRTPYPEIRAAVERLIPHALAQPRSPVVDPPALPLDVADQNSRDFSFDADDATWTDAFTDFDLRMDFPDQAGKAAKAKIAQSGFDAFGWYAPWHEYTAGAWGIYIDAAALDELACSISEDLKRGRFRRRDDALAARYAWRLVYGHELFHARVEAGLSWSELHAVRAIYRPYIDGVYRKAFNTDDCREEALANFWAYRSAMAEGDAQQKKGLLSDEQRSALDEVVHAYLDMSPPGCRRWRDGESRSMWRVLATEAVQARVGVDRLPFALPLEALFQDALPFELLWTDDIPLRWVGTGRIAAALALHPSTMRLPSRKELRAVIQGHFGYRLVPGGGKGSHEKFMSPDSKHAYPLPQRDPVSPAVFAGFLRHFDLTKSQYLVLTGRAQQPA